MSSMGDSLPTNDPSNVRFDTLHQLLELEIEKLRDEASAATLRARATELEIKLRTLSATSATPPSEATPLSSRTSTPAAIESAQSTVSSSRSVSSPQPVSSSPPVKFNGWAEVASKLGLEPQPDSQPQRRFDAAVKSPVPRPRMGSVEEVPEKPLTAEEESQNDSDRRENDPDHRDLVQQDRGDQPNHDQPNHDPPAASSDSAESLSFALPNDVAAADLGADTSSDRGSLPSISIDSSDDAKPLRRRRPMAIVVSAAAHGLLLVLLTSVGYQVARPKDQIAITASPSDNAEVAMETFEIDTSEPEPQPIEPPQPAASPFEAELDPIGTIAAGIPNIDPSPAFVPPSASLASLKSSTSISKLSSQPAAKMEFCGVKGGGNHFVYVIDSSNSIGESFQSARAELIRSIDLLKPNQRFYVICYDAKIEYMRIRDPRVPETTSVRATDQNKAALRRWALTITQEKGKSGDAAEAMAFALGLRPDVIFLLSDGEFPEKVETMLKENNKIENLFDAPRPISIIHTICYHNREGETRMKRVAAQNGGQYRYVPK